MAITSVHVDRHTYEDMGVGEWELDKDSLEMRGLGSIVVLAGPNGGGKSRILRTVERMMRKQLSQEQLAETRLRLVQLRSQIEGSQNHLRQLTADKASNDSIAIIEGSISGTQSQIQSYERALRACAVITLSSDDSRSIVSLVPTSPKLVDPGQSTDNAVRDLANQLIQGKGSMGAESSGPAHARTTLRADLFAKNRRREHPSVGKSPEEQQAETLRAMVVEALGPSSPLDLNNDLNITIGGRSDYPSTLSPGQQILFQFVCILHAQGGSLSDSIVFMDEPENHLHPAAIAHVVETLRGKLKTGQLWIATHSVPLIAKLSAAESECLWYVADSKPKREGRNPEIVLNGLVGGSDGVRDINEFTSLPAKFAALRFLSECLQDPGVVGPAINDPQLTQIRSLLWKRVTEGAEPERPLRILDYGAGQGRLLRELSTSDELRFDYIAFDPSDKMIEHCRRDLINLRRETENRCFSDLHELASRIDASSVDVIVMCNVLHEIPPEQWLRLFGPSGTITKLLRADGHLLVVEDYGLPKGERAHDFGFLLLDEPELRQLFRIKESDGAERYMRYASTTPNYENRLAAHMISQQCVDRVTADSRRAAIRQVNTRAKDSVRRFLQSKESTSKAGRSYALSTQLLANSTLWLEADGAV